MLRMILNKILSIIPLLLIISIILFLLINLLPGDATATILGEGASVEAEAAMRAKLGLDQPLYIQYFRWMGNVIRGNLGNSIVSNQPVWQKLLERLPVTLELAILSIILATIIAIPSGIISAVKRNSVADNISGVLSMIGVAVPPFWMGMMLVIVFALTLHWLPASGYVPITENLLLNLKCYIMPTICLGFSYAGSLTRQTRSAMLEILYQDYVMTARVKGLNERVVIWKHCLRNALIPIITVLAMSLGRLIGGTVVVETIFLLPGLGKAIVDAIFSRDYPVVMGFVLVIATFIVVLNTIVDVLYIVIDPRVSRNRAID